MKKRTMGVLGGALLLAAVPLAGSALAVEAPTGSPDVTVTVANHYSHSYDITEITCKGEFTGTGQFDGTGFENTISGVVNPDGTFVFTAVYEDVWSDDGVFYDDPTIPDWGYSVSGQLSGGTFDDASSDYTDSGGSYQTTSGTIADVGFADPAECIASSTSTTDRDERVAWTAAATTGKGKAQVTKWKETWTTETTRVESGEAWDGDSWEPFADRETVSEGTPLTVACTISSGKSVQPSFCQPTAPSEAWTAPPPVDPLACPAGQASLATWTYEGTKTGPHDGYSLTWVGAWTNDGGTGAWVSDPTNEHTNAGGFYWDEAADGSVDAIVLKSLKGEILTNTTDLDGGLSANIFEEESFDVGFNVVRFCGAV